MAAYTLLCTARNGRPINRQAIAAAADTVTVSAIGLPGNRATVQMVTTTSGLLFSKAAGGALANGWPVAAGVPLTLVFQDGETFEVAGTVAGFIDYLVVSP
jgi:hypothetical protein